MTLASLTYLGLLVLSLAGLGLLDWHRRLALFADARRTLLAVGVAVAFFLVWDTVAIGLGIFARGNSRYLTGVELWPEMTLEEPLFLVLLSYVTLLIWRLLSSGGGRPRQLGARPATGRRPAGGHPSLMGRPPGPPAVSAGDGASEDASTRSEAGP